MTSLLSALAFNFFHLPPVGRFTIADNRNWVALAAFVVVAVIVGAMAEAVRNRAREEQIGPPRPRRRSGVRDRRMLARPSGARVHSA